MTIKDIIKTRKSVREYTKQSIEANKKDIIISEMKRVSGDRFRFELIDHSFTDGSKIGTYGMIQGAQSYIVGILDKDFSKDKKTAVDFGYAFEEIILRATDQGLGTCWMVSTFNSSDIKKIIEVKDSESIVMVSPVGYGVIKDTIRKKLTRLIVRSHTRKPWSELFFEGDFSRPLDPSKVEELKPILEAVRLSPSAVNYQPWRLVKTDDSIDFYVAKTKMDLSQKYGLNVTMNDMGIAKCHFDLVAKENKVAGEWIEKKEFLSELEYVTSFVMR